MISDVLLESGWRAILLSALTLLVLLVLKRRSPAEKSWIAHVGVLATMLLPLLMWAGPDWTVQLPASVERMAPTSWQPEAQRQSLNVRRGLAPEPADSDGAESGTAVDAETAVPALYLLVASMLLLLTLAGTTRLIVLRRSARVLTDPRWISALANAQARIGQKHATALLVSNDIASPVSWGVVRPVILLDERAASSPRHAEAIIAHELAHVAQADWAKLILCRVATALMWFNPLIWILARQCHQLREEAADDAVLKHQVSDHEYVELLIQAVKHESRGLLLPANGVAPGPKSLKMRVARVLDTTSCRRPVAKAWSAPAFVVAILGTTCIAAINPVQSAVLIKGEILALPRFSSIEVTNAAVTLRPGPTQRVTVVTNSLQTLTASVDQSGILHMKGCSNKCRGGVPQIDIVTPAVAMIATSARASVRTYGRFPPRSSLALTANGGSLTDARGIEARRVSAAVTGGGLIETRVKDELAASVTNGGSIIYCGDPPAVSSSITAGGAVQKAANAPDC